MSRRLLAYIILFLSILFLPFWIYLPLLFVASVIFGFFWEGIVFAFFIEVLYGGGEGIILFSPVALSVLVLIILLIPIRKRLRWNIENF